MDVFRKQADQRDRRPHAEGGLEGVGEQVARRIKSPDGKILTIPSSPSDWRSELNWISQARDSGVSPELLV